MGGRGASSGKVKKSGGGGVKAEAIQAEAKQQEQTKSFLFNRIDEIKKFGDREYKLKNVPRGAKGFLTMFQKNAAKLGSTFGLNEEFVIAKYATKKGYKNLDKKNKRGSKGDYKRLLEKSKSPSIRENEKRKF
jgi:50S ribosomal protein L21